MINSTKRSRNNKDSGNSNSSRSSSSSRQVHGAIQLLSQLRRSVASNYASENKDSSDEEDDPNAEKTKQQPQQRTAAKAIDFGDAFGYGRDRRDSSGKTFRVVVPKKLLLWVGLIFFGLPIFLFLYVEGTRYYLLKSKLDYDKKGFQSKATNGTINTEETATSTTAEEEHTTSLTASSDSQPNTEQHSTTNPTIENKDFVKAANAIMDDGLETPVVAENEAQQSDANTNYTSLIEQGQR